MEGVGQIDEPGHLLRRVGRPARAIVVGVAREQGHRPTRESGEPGDRGTAELAPELEERAAVHECVDDRPHLVGLAPVAGNCVDEPLVAAVRVVVARRARRQPVHRRG